MVSTIGKAVSAIFIIILGQLMKRTGVFGHDDYKIITKICLNITLPAAIIMGFSAFQRDSSLYVVAALGLVCNLLVLACAWAATSKLPAEKRFMPLLNIPGYQIGTFTLPYIGGVLGPYGILVTCMFDVGNSIMSAGGTYALASAALDGKRSVHMARDIAVRLFSSAPFDFYMAMLVWVTFGLKVPQWLISLVSPAAGANFFIAMFMIGMMIEIKISRQQIKAVIEVLAARYLSAALMALFFWRCLPFSPEIRRVLAIVIFSPVSALGPVFTDKCGGDAGLASLVGSISIIMSIACITAVCLLTGI